MPNSNNRQDAESKQNESSNNTSSSMAHIIQRLGGQLPNGVSASQRFLGFLFLLNNAFAQEATNQTMGNTTSSSTDTTNSSTSSTEPFRADLLLESFAMTIILFGIVACFMKRQLRKVREREGLRLAMELSPVDHEMVDLEAFSETHDAHEENVESVEPKEKSLKSLPAPKTFEERYEAVKDVATKAEKEQAEAYKDPYTLEIMQTPVSLIPCGHVADETSVLNALKRNGDGMECSIGREKVGVAGGFKYLSNKPFRGEVERFIKMLEQHKLEQSKTMLEEESVEEKDAEHLEKEKGVKEEDVAETQPLIGPSNS